MNIYKIPVLIFLVIFISCNKNEEAMQAFSGLDIERFMGDWYVIGLAPNFIEEGASNGIESYRLNPKGQVEISYSFIKNGKPKKMSAKGFIQNPENTIWKVQFFWPVKFPYYVLNLDTDYQYTVVGVPNRKYVWIMSRTPEIDDDTYAGILQRLEDIGYMITDIKRMEQKW